jgi:hypothetical protein
MSKPSITPKTFNMFNFKEKVDASLYISSIERCVTINFDINWLFKHFTPESCIVAYDFMLERSKKQNYRIKFLFSTSNKDRDFDDSVSIIRSLMLHKI